VREAACLGAALLAGTAAGGYRNLDEAVKQTVSLKDIYNPDENAQALYNEKYSVYREIYDTLKNINSKL
jgi:xylulokinase